MVNTPREGEAQRPRGACSVFSGRWQSWPWAVEEEERWVVVSRWWFWSVWNVFSWSMIVSHVKDVLVGNSNAWMWWWAIKDDMVLMCWVVVVVGLVGVVGLAVEVAAEVAAAVEVAVAAVEGMPESAAACCTNSWMDIVCKERRGGAATVDAVGPSLVFKTRTSEAFACARILSKLAGSVSLACNLDRVGLEWTKHKTMGSLQPTPALRMT